MRIPEFQPNQPTQKTPDAATAIGPRRATVSSMIGGSAAYREAETTLPPGEAVQAVDALDLSPLSLAILGSQDSNARVESLEKDYSLGKYSVNPEALARTLLQTIPTERGNIGPMPDPTSKDRTQE